MRVLITGAGRAIGRATATELAARGHDVVATARDTSLLDDLDVAARLALDVRDPSSIRSVLEEAGEVDAVVNNAALGGHGVLDGFPLDRLREMFETNTIAPLALVQALLPAWRSRGSGVIVNVSSVQGRVATPLDGAYAATKYALETLHYEVGHFGIRVVIIEPGFIAPGMKPVDPHRGDAVYEELWSQWEGTDSKVTGPEGRPGPELVARAIADAVDDDATPLRVPVGADAEMVLGARAQLDDAGFESLMRSTLDLTW